MRHTKWTRNPVPIAHKPTSQLLNFTIKTLKLHLTVAFPLESIGPVMDIDVLIGMFRAVSNCTGDVVASKIVEQMEKARKKRA